MIRVKVPGGVKLMPHSTRKIAVYTVISGVFYIGLGDEFDPDKLQAYPPGAVIILPGDTSHISLGEIRRVRHTSNRDWSPGNGIPERERRSAK